jgi:hypothetical protein
MTVEKVLTSCKVCGDNHYMAATADTKFQIGSVVRYSDMANPGITYVVIGINDNPWSTYVLRNTETFEVTTTDGRQRGWKVMAE